MAQFIFNPTQSYLPAYNQLQYGFVSTNYTKSGFSYLLDVIVGGQTVSTLTSNNVPGKTWSNIDIHRVASTELSYDLNFDVAGAQFTPNSIKKLELKLGERYNNIHSIIGLTAMSSGTFNGYTEIELSDATDISVNDRIEIKLSDDINNTHLNTFWKVLNKSGDNLIIDDDEWQWPGYTQTGTLRNGVEYYDASFNNGSVDIETSTAHNLEAGDTFLLQLDTSAFATINFTAYTPGDSILTLETNFGGVTYSLISASVSGTDANNLANNLTTQINADAPLDFTAFNNPSDNPSVVYVYTRRNKGDIAIGADFDFSTTGIIAYTQSAFSKTPQQGPIGGWNSFSNLWKVKSVLSTTKFSTDIPWQFDTITGSQRGSIINFDTRVRLNTDTLENFWLMNHTFQYDDFFDYPLPPLALIEDPRDCISFSDWSDLQTVDIMTLLGPTGSNIIIIV